MSILSSLDWSRFSFDVLCIENQYSAEANEAIKLFLASRHAPLLPDPFARPLSPACCGTPARCACVLHTCLVPALCLRGPTCVCV